MKSWARIVGPALALIVSASMVAQAQAPERSLRPVLRAPVYPVALPSFAPEVSLRPVLRRGGDTSPRVTRVAAAAPVAAAPIPRAEATPAKLTRKEKRALKKQGIGKICRNKKILGKEIDPIPGKLRGCGIPRGAVKVYQIDDVKLSTPAVVNCDLAGSLEKWVDKGLKKSVRRYGGGVTEIKVAASYACRTRNSRPGAKISEHGKGNAIDISAVKLKNGESISVLRDWGGGKKGKILKKMHKDACGPFGTVLGPNADRYHQDHFHFDVAKHKWGDYCR